MPQTGLEGLLESSVTVPEYAARAGELLKLRCNKAAFAGLRVRLGQKMRHISAFG